MTLYDTQQRSLTPLHAYLYRLCSRAYILERAQPSNLMCHVECGAGSEALQWSLASMGVDILITIQRDDDSAYVVNMPLKIRVDSTLPLSNFISMT